MSADSASLFRPGDRVRVRRGVSTGFDGRVGKIEDGPARDSDGVFPSYYVHIGLAHLWFAGYELDFVRKWEPPPRASKGCAAAGVAGEE